MILIFDTETTGLRPGRVIQLSYVMATKTDVKGKNFFFYTPFVEPSAIAVHGFTPEKLAVLSDGKTFSEFLEEIDDDFRAADLTVAHNFPFDFSFMSAEFGYESRIFHYKEKFDTMRELKNDVAIPSPAKFGKYKYPKLVELAAFYDIYDYDVTRKSIELFGDGAASHDARFDVTQTYLSLFEAAKRNERVRSVLEKYLSPCAG